MLEMIYNIPECVGWTIVGIIGVVCLITGARLTQIFVGMYRERKEVE